MSRVLVRDDTTERPLLAEPTFGEWRSEPNGPVALADQDLRLLNSRLFQARQRLAETWAYQSEPEVPEVFEMPRPPTRRATIRVHHVEPAAFVYIDDSPSQQEN